MGTRNPLLSQHKLLQSAGTLSPRGRSGQSEERDIWEFSSSGWIREVVEEGERRLGGGPGAMEGGLPWGEQPYSFNGLLCLSYKLSSQAHIHIYMRVFSTPEGL